MARLRYLILFFSITFFHTSEATGGQASLAKIFDEIVELSPDGSLSYTLERPRPQKVYLNVRRPIYSADRETVQVFFPEKESYYFGLVKKYDEERDVYTVSVKRSFGWEEYRVKSHCVTPSTYLEFLNAELRDSVVMVCIRGKRRDGSPVVYKVPGSIRTVLDHDEQGHPLLYNLTVKINDSLEDVNQISSSEVTFLEN